MQLCRVVPCYERSLYCRYVAVLASTYPLAAPAERDTLFLPNSCNDRKFPRHCQGNNRVMASGRPIIPTRDAGCSTGTFLCILPELPSPASLHFRLIARNQDEIPLLCRNFFSRITLPCIVPVHFFCSPSFNDCLSSRCSSSSSFPHCSMDARRLIRNLRFLRARTQKVYRLSIRSSFQCSIHCKRVRRICIGNGSQNVADKTRRR